MTNNKFSQQPSQKGRKPQDDEALPERGSHKAQFLRNHQKSHKAHAAFLSLVTNCLLQMEQPLPWSLPFCWFIFVLHQCEICGSGPGLMGTNGVQAPQRRPAHVPFCIRPFLNTSFNKPHSCDAWTWNCGSFYFLSIGI